MNLILLLKVVALFCLVGTYAAASEKIVVCYYGTWATYRHGDGQFDTANINPHLCTHLVYSFVGINSQGTVISLDSYLDLPDYSGRDNFRKFTSLKQENPKLKTLLAVGGWNEGSAKYSTMAASPTLRQNFIISALKMVQEYNFDGLDLDWEYPNRRDTVHGQADVDNFSQLIKELKEEFGKYDLLVTAAVSAVASSASLSYDIPTISKYLDYIGIMAYDMYGSWDPVTGHNAPLHKGLGDENSDSASLNTVDVAVEYWLEQGCPPEKLVVGLPFYGRTFTLTNANDYSVRSPSSGAGIAGPYTATSGSIGYNEFCYKLKTESWDVYYDDLAKVPFAVQGSNWVSYDDSNSLNEKIKYSLEKNVGGFMVWSIETDDFHGLCGGEDYPLLRSINKAIGRDVDGNGVFSTTSSTTSSSTTSSSTSEGSSSTTESTSTTLRSTSTTTTVSPEAGSVCKVEGYNANTKDCSSFYVCVVGVDGNLFPYEFECPESLLWDHEAKYCNYSDLVKCIVSL